MHDELHGNESIDASEATPALSKRFGTPRQRLVDACDVGMHSPMIVAQMQGISMHPLHIHMAPDTSALGLQFPMKQCANCGTRMGLQEATLELRQTTYFLVAGTELLLRFPVASCARCAPTMTRRALSLFQRVFLIALCIAIVLTFVFMAVALDLDMPAWLKSHWLAASVIGGGVPAWLWFERHRPEHPQTSYYQPIRLLRLKRTFFGGRIDRMVLGFTNRDVLREFIAANRPLIDAGFLRAEAI